MTTTHQKVRTRRGEAGRTRTSFMFRSRVTFRETPLATLFGAIQGYSQKSHDLSEPAHNFGLPYDGTHRVACALVGGEAIGWLATDRDRGAGSLPYRRNMLIPLTTGGRVGTQDDGLPLFEDRSSISGIPRDWMMPPTRPTVLGSHCHCIQHHLRFVPTSVNCMPEHG